MKLRSKKYLIRIQDQLAEILFLDLTFKKMARISKEFIFIAIYQEKKELRITSIRYAFD